MQKTSLNILKKFRKKDYHPIKPRRSIFNLLEGIQKSNEIHK